MRDLFDLGVESFVQDVWITNHRVNCCGGRLKDALVDLLDSDRNLVESRLIKGAVGNGKSPRRSSMRILLLDVTSEFPCHGMIVCI